MNKFRVWKKIQIWTNFDFEQNSTLNKFGIWTNFEFVQNLKHEQILYLNKIWILNNFKSWIILNFKSSKIAQQNREKPRRKNKTRPEKPSGIITKNKKKIKTEEAYADGPRPNPSARRRSEQRPARGRSIGISPHVSVEKMKPVTRWSMRLRMDSNFQRPKAVSWAKVNTIFHDARQCGNIWRPALQVGAHGDVALRPASDADADAAQCRAVPWHAPDMATTAAVSSRDATTAHTGPRRS
jgi:hypothetical protein